MNGNWTAWALIGGSSVSLKSDVAVAYNGFSKVQKEEVLRTPSKVVTFWLDSILSHVNSLDILCFCMASGLMLY